MGESDSMDTLVAELQGDADTYRALARANYRAAYVLAIVAILASFFAGLSVAGDWFSRTSLALLSALPGGVLVVYERLKLDERSRWHWKKYYGLKALQDQLRYEGKSPAEVSALRRKLNDEMEPLWPGLGKAPGAADRHGA